MIRLKLVSFRFIVSASLAAAACTSGTSGVSPARTSPEITTADARSRIYLVADDSMLGRQSGTIGNYKMTEYLAREVARLGLEPGGDSGSFFQTVPLVRRAIDSAATSITVGNRAISLFTEFVAVRPNRNEQYGLVLSRRPLETIYGGRAGDSTATLSAAAVAGKMVILDAPLGENGQPSGAYATPGAISVSRYPGAAAIVIAAFDLVTPATANAFRNRANAVAQRAGTPPRPVGFLVTAAVAEEIMGARLSTLTPGRTGATVTASAAFSDIPVAHPARNVIAIVRGADPQLRNEYVVIGAHSDHVGIAARVVDHDSLRSYYRVMRPEGAQTRGMQPAQPTPEQWRQIRSSLDSLRRIRPPRLDSISNGADDDGSGSVALLEMAEAFASSPRPRRSILLIWHTAEEAGLLGSTWFTDFPTVPLGAIVAALNMDMVGRGSAIDIAGGGPRYLQVIGSRRLSTDLGDVVDSVNASSRSPYAIDYSWDASGHPMMRYCRSDHYMYARKGIPIAYFSRGYHPDYHVVTDEPQYINYEGLANVARFVGAVGTALANRNDRPVRDKPVQNPLLPCRQ